MFNLRHGDLLKTKNLRKANYFDRKVMFLVDSIVPIRYDCGWKGNSKPMQNTPNDKIRTQLSTVAHSICPGGEPCPHCGGKAFHKNECREMADFKPGDHVLAKYSNRLDPVWLRVVSFNSMALCWSGASIATTAEFDKGEHVAFRNNQVLEIKR